MGCFHPLAASYYDDPFGSGKKVRVLGSYRNLNQLRSSDYENIILLPCGQCIFCRLRKSLEWTIRCFHELSLSGVGSFITLTYDDQHLPRCDLDHPTLNYRDVQLFLKRFRKQFGSVRFFVCGEYGTRFRRPHYHMILFGFKFPDLIFNKHCGSYDLFRSPTLEKLWPLGFSLVGNTTPHSVNYVCRYNLKKVIGKTADEWYDGRTPEFIRMSLKPGIGSDWLSLFQGDVYKVDRLTDDVYRDAVRFEGRDSRPPRYYDKLLGRVDEDLWNIIHSHREEFAAELPPPTVEDLLQCEQHAQYVARSAYLEKAMRNQHSPHLLENNLTLISPTCNGRPAQGNY